MNNKKLKKRFKKRKLLVNKLKIFLNKYKTINIILLLDQVYYNKKYLNNYTKIKLLFKLMN